MTEVIRFGAIKPKGWLRESMERDMKGNIGNLDKLLPELIREQDIYGADRLGKNSVVTDLGRDDGDEDAVQSMGSDDQFMWWNSETQSNWWDAFCRNAPLLDDPTDRKKLDGQIETILKTQDADGYLGIYVPELRFRQTGENGELWAKSTLFRYLLAYWEATSDERVWQALVKAAGSTMKGFPMGESEPFAVKDSFAGLCHGLTITDAFYRLYELSGEQMYLDYALWLYEDYSAHQVSEEDMQIGSIENPHYFWKNHAVHTYEHIRSVAVAAKHSPQKYAELLQLVLAKLPYYQTPSGGPIGDEWIFERTANANHTGYEYCSLHELLDSLSLVMKITGDLEPVFNSETAIFGAVFPHFCVKFTCLASAKLQKFSLNCEKTP